MDGYSRYVVIQGLLNQTCQQVIAAIQDYISIIKTSPNMEYFNIDCIKTDAGTQFVSDDFRQHCLQHKIDLSIAAPKHQEQNALAERTWQSVAAIMRKILLHARLPETFSYFAVTYAAHIFNVLPIKGSILPNGAQSTPYHLFHNKRPCIAQFRVFGCPCVVKKHTISKQGQPSNNNTFQRGVRGIYIGFPPKQKGFQIYIPATGRTITSLDVEFDENFKSAIAYTWTPFHDALSLRPTHSSLLESTPAIEHTGTISDSLHLEEEMLKKTAKQEAEEETLLQAEEQAEELEMYTEQEDIDTDEIKKEDLLQFYDNFINEEPDFTQLDKDDDKYNEFYTSSQKPVNDNDRWAFVKNRRRKCIRYKNTIYNSANFAGAKINRVCKDETLLKAFEKEVLWTNEIDAKGNDPTPFMPPPTNIVQVLRIKNTKIKNAWLRAYKKELESLIKHGTFKICEPRKDEAIIPIMDDNRVKILENGKLDKLKNRLVVRGDIQRAFINEVTWSPTASHRSLKLFLALAAKYKCRVLQLDFIGAFLQAPMRERVFVKLPAVFGKLFPEFAEYCGRPVLLEKSMYGQTVSGRNWYLELDEWLVKQFGFKRSPNCPAMYVKRMKDGSMLRILNYVDDMLYFCENQAHIKEFEKLIAARFAVEFKGQASWYLSVRIKQDKNYNITIDQDRYVQSILRRFLDQVKTSESKRFHHTPLPSTFKATKTDLAQSEEESITVQEEFNIDFAACVGCLIYLSYTRPDIIFAVNKMAKFTRKPGRYHLECIVHVLRYLRDNSNYGIKYYHKKEESPLYSLLKTNNIDTSQELIMFTDSSWQDEIDTSKSTGCYMIMFQGGVVDHSSNIPDPIAMSSAEAEYNEACLGAMGGAHVKMLLEDLEMDTLDNQKVLILVDSKSAKDMGESFKTTKRTRHILRRYHYVREGQEAGHHQLIWIPNEYQLADIGTKPVEKRDMEKRIKYILVKTIESTSQTKEEC